MKVLIVTTNHGSLAYGVGTYVESFARALRALGVDTRIISSPYYDTSDPTISTVDPKGPDPARQDGTWNPLKVLQENAAMAAACRRLVDDDVDVVHVQDYWAAVAGSLIARELDAPLIVTKHSGPSRRGSDLDDVGKYLHNYLVDVEHWMLSDADRIIAVSETIRQRIAEVGPGSGWLEKCSVIHPASDIAERWADVSDGEGKGDSTSSFRMLLAGRLERSKGGDLALHAMASLRDLPIRLVIAGGGNDGSNRFRKRLESLTRELGLESRVDFLGHIGQEQLARWYSKSDLALVPSRREAFGLVAAEALAMGTPVIASNTGGLAEQVEHRVNGLLFEPGSVADLAEKIRFAVANPETMATMASKGREIARGRTWIDVANSTLSIYRNQLRGKDRPPGS